MEIAVNFKMWLEDTEDNFSHWKDIILGYLNLDQENGLSQTLDTFDSQHLKEKLQGLGEFTKLSPDTQNKVMSMIDGPQGGTVGDLIRQMSSESIS